jgi:hypothetical protein
MRFINASWFPSRSLQEAGAFSLNHIQLYVGTLSTDETIKTMAISLLTGTTNPGPASQVTIYILTQDRARR